VRHNVFFNFALPEGNLYAGSGRLDGQGVPLDFFADVHVRRAFNACFDRGAFITDTLARQGEMPRALTLPDQPGYANSPTADFDPARCAEEFRAVEFKTQDDLTLWDAGFAVQLPYRDGDNVQQTVVDQLARNLAQINAKFVITPVQSRRWTGCVNCAPDRFRSPPSAGRKTCMIHTTGIGLTCSIPTLRVSTSPTIWRRSIKR
jgi:peptide/nickel transport system substrate-binding protein